MKISEYRHTDGYRRWELFYEEIQLVLLNEEAPEQYSSDLLAFKDLELIWCLSPETNTKEDYIVNIWVQDGDIYAGSFSGFEYKINYKTGEVFETKFTK